jgi:serine/threonine protein kinase
MLAPNTILRNRYRILQLLGQGGMGAVYQAIDENLNRMVAVKETFATSEELRIAFRREAELLANLSHPALPKSIEHFSENQSDFFVMEFIPGNDLADLLAKRGGPFPEAEVLGWAEKVLSVLGYLHAKKLVHRDIKPSNIKLTSEGELSLLDFGLAKGAVGQMPTIATAKSVAGYTLAFAPLEQILGQGTDARSDLYSLGATLYNLLTGKTPTNASTRFQAMDDGGEDPLPLIQHENPHVSPNTAGIIHSAMAINRRRRPESAADMRSALRGAFRETTRPKPAKPRPEQVKPTEPSPAPKPRDPTISVQAPIKPLGWNSRILKPDDSPAPVQPRSTWSPTKVMLLTVGGVVLLTVLAGVVSALKTWGGGVGPNPQPTVSETPMTPLPSPSPSPSPSPALQAGATMKNGIGIEFSFIPPGSFMMGSNNYQPDETPVHRVTISYGFFMGKYEITQGLWESIMATNPSRYRECGADCPVENVSWNSIQEFISALNSRNDGYVYRLPTEAEWEYASRAGTTRDLPVGPLDRLAWYTHESIELRTGRQYYPPDFQPTHPVGMKRPNAFGVHDMLGNVTEWCEDYYHNSYSGSPIDGKPRLKPSELGERVLRGGSSLRGHAEARFAKRYKSAPDIGGGTFENWFEGYGFRLVAVPRNQ